MNIHWSYRRGDTGTVSTWAEYGGKKVEASWPEVDLLRTTTHPTTSSLSRCVLQQTREK